MPVAIIKSTFCVMVRDSLASAAVITPPKTSAIGSSVAASSGVVLAARVL